jgi:hypothetical protein
MLFGRLKMADVTDVEKIEDTVALDHRSAAADVRKLEREIVDVFDLGRQHLRFTPSASIRLC